MTSDDSKLWEKISNNTRSVVGIAARVTVVERDIAEVKSDVKEILTNHLPHISNQITALTVKVTIGAAIASLLASALVGWLFRQ